MLMTVMIDLMIHLVKQKMACMDKKSRKPEKRPTKKAKASKTEYEEMHQSDAESEIEVDSDGEEIDFDGFYDPDNVEDDVAHNEEAKEVQGDGYVFENFTAEKIVMNQEPFIEDLPYSVGLQDPNTS